MSYILFSTVLAYIAWRASENAPELPLPNLSRGVVPVAAIICAALVWGTVWYVNARPKAANRALLSALAPQQEGLQKNLEYFKEAISYGTFGTQEAREQLAQAAAQLAPVESIPVEVKQQFLDTAAREMAIMAEESPLDARFPLFLGVLLDAYGNYENATPALEKAHELSPKKQAILFELASNLFARGDTAVALARYKEAYELAPEFSDARLYYAAALIRTNQDALAEEILAPLLESGVAADSRIAAAYLSRGRYDKIVSIWQARVAAAPNDVQAYFTLAAAHFGAGNSSRAIAVLQEVGNVVPAAKAQADALIEQIRNGTAKIQ